MKETCIMIFPEFSNMKIIDKIREKYDPLAKHVRPHITLVFPFVSDLDTLELRNHIEGILLETSSFNIELNNITPVQSFGNYLFLNIKNGQDEIINIHEKLYTGILEPFLPQWLRDVEYYPHMTVGNIENEEIYKTATLEVKDIDEVFETTVEKISVEIIDENQDSIIEMEIELK